MKLFSIINKKYISMKKICLLLSFILKRNIFEMEYSSLILEILGKLVELEYPNFKGDCYRSPEKSASLFVGLVKSYIKEKSSKTLEQLVVVLRDEILNREWRNGRE